MNNFTVQWVKAPKKVPTISKDVSELIHHTAPPPGPPTLTTAPLKPRSWLWWWWLLPILDPELIWLFCPKPHNQLFHLSSSPLLSCPPSSQYNLLHFPAHRDGEMQCNARHLFYRDTTKVGQRRGGEKELQKSSLASDNEAFCCWATFVVRVDGCYYYTQLTLCSFTTTALGVLIVDTKDEYVHLLCSECNGNMKHMT